MFGGVEVIKVLPWVIINLVSLVLSIYQGYEYGRRSLQAEWDAEKSATVTAQRDKEAALQASMDKLREDKHRETARLNATVRALTDSLRNRPERPASMPEVASTGDAGRGCTGAELYRPDSQFLVGEFTRAEEIRLALITCQKAYKSALMLYPATQEDASH